MKKTLLRLARSEVGSRAVRLVIRLAPRLLPGKRIYHSKTLIAFLHPVPAYPVHVLLVPLQALTGPAALQNEHAGLLREIWNASVYIAASMSLPTGWRLVVNAGHFQDVGVLHFHLIAEKT